MKSGAAAAPQKKDIPAKEEASSIFQRQRVDMLLGELVKKFAPPPMVKPQQPESNYNSNFFLILY